MPTPRIMGVNIYVHVQSPTAQYDTILSKFLASHNAFTKRNDYSFAIILVILYADLSQLLLVQQEKCNVEMERH